MYCILKLFVYLCIEAWKLHKEIFLKATQKKVIPRTFLEWLFSFKKK